MKKARYTRWIYVLPILAAALVSPAGAQVLIHQESFEAPPLGSNYSVLGEFWDGGDDFFIRTNNAFANYPLHPVNPDGSMYYVARDTYTGGAPLPEPPGGTSVVTIASVDVSGYENLIVRIGVQDADGDFEAISEGANGDFLQVFVGADGVTSLVGQITGTLPNDGALYDDTDLDGTGDTNATATTSNFTDFEYAIPGTPAGVVVQIKTRLDFGSERLAIDNLRILGDLVPVQTVILNSNATLITSTSAVLNALFDGTGAVYGVSVYWGTSDPGTNAAFWPGSASLGLFNDHPLTNLALGVSGLTPNTEYFFNWRATNTTEHIWSRPALRFKTAGPPEVNNGGGAVEAVTQADLQGVLTNGGSADVTIFWGESNGGTAPGAWDTAVNLGALGEGAFQTTALNLLFGVPYFYRSYATNANGESWAPAATGFASLQPPGVGITNLSASSITETSGVMNASFNGIDSIFSVTLYWGPTDEGTVPGAWANVVEFGAYTNHPATNLTYVLDGLSLDSTNYYTWRASNQVVDIWGSPSELLETPGAPSVDNAGGATGVGEGVVNLNGSFTSPDRGDVTIYFGSSDGGTTPGGWDASTNLGPVAAPTFFAIWSNLIHGVDYFYRSYATNAYADSWAPATVRFSAPLPIGAGLLALSPSELTTTSVVLNVELSATGSIFDVTAYWGPVDGGTDPVAWSTNAFLGSFTNITQTNLSVDVTGLASNTLYAYTFLAANAATSIWIQPSLTFTTLGAPPLVNNAGGATNISALSATLRGELSQGGIATAWMVWGDNDPGTLNTGDWDNVRSMGEVDQSVVFSAGISGLSAVSTYYYRSFVTNEFGVAWSGVATFTTPVAAPPLDILDLDANGGINPATGQPWKGGDTYRLAFTTSELSPATSTNIDYYNTFVQNAANASPLNIGIAQDVTWKAIASTAAVDARDNTSTHVASNGTGEAIFLLNGTTVVATNYIALWTFDGHDNPINRTELLTVPSFAGTTWGDVWSGTMRWSYSTNGRGATYGTADTAGAGPLGDTDGNAMRGLWGHTSGTHWIWRWGGASTYLLPLYALSDPLTVRGATITKTASVSDINLDLGVTNLTYTIDIGNGFTQALGGIVITDSLPAEVSFISSVPPANQTNGNDYVFDLGILGPETNFVITFNVLVTSAVPSVVTNVATFSTTNVDVNVVPPGEAETLLYRATDLALTKTADVSGSNISYTILVTNLSLSAAQNVVVTDTLPPGTTFDGSTPLPAAVSGNDYAFNLGTLNAGEASSIALSLVWASGVPGKITNVARVTTTWFEDVLTNNIDRAVSLVGQGADLALVKTVSSTNLIFGATNLTYTLTVNNIGTTSAVSVVVTDSLPAGLTFIMAVPAPVLTNGNEYTFDLGGLATGAGTSIVVDVAYTAGLLDISLTNWASVYTLTEEIGLLNNTDWAETGVPDLGLDTDGDGMTDGEEVIAGTRILDPTSYLWLMINKTANQDVRQLGFPSVLTRTYHLQSSTNLYTGPWVDVQTNIPGVDAWIYTFRTSVLQRIYYRVGAEWP